MADESDKSNEVTDGQVDKTKPRCNTKGEGTRGNRGTHEGSSGGQRGEDEWQGESEESSQQSSRTAKQQASRAPNVKKKERDGGWRWRTAMGEADRQTDRQKCGRMRGIGRWVRQNGDCP